MLAQENNAMLQSFWSDSLQIYRNMQWIRMGYHWQCGSIIFIQIYLMGSERCTFWATECITDLQGHQKSLTLVPMHVPSSSVNNSNIYAILHRFTRVAGFLLRRAISFLLWLKCGYVEAMRKNNRKLM